VGDLSRLAFLNARVSLYAARLQPVESLLPYIDSPHELPADYLESIGLPGLTDRQPDSAGELEQHFMSCLAVEAEGVMHAMPPETRGLIKQWMRRFEFMNLKSLIRCKLTSCDLELSREYLLDIGHFARLPLDEYLHSEDIVEFLRMLSAQDATLARKIRLHIEDPEQLFLLEAAMDYHFYEGLLASCEPLSPEERDGTRRFIGRIIDTVNLAWLLRYRIAYGIHPPHTFFMLARTGLLLGPGRLAQLARLDDLDAMRAALPAEHCDCLEGVNSVADAENRMLHNNLAHARKVLRHEQFHLVRALAYLYLRERQLLDVHQLLKGKLLGFDPALIREALLGVAA
jgi:V/A-type H+/Na+-transporting ATPase subunit C